MLEEKEKFQKLADEKALKSFESQDKFDEFIVFTLNNFGYRFFDKEESEQAVEKSDPLTYFIRTENIELKWGLMHKNAEIKQGSKDLAVKHPPKSGGHLCHELEVRLEHKDPERSGKALMNARVYWNYPSFSKERGQFFEKQEVFLYEDALHLRNKMAKYLDELCELFN